MAAEKSFAVGTHWWQRPRINLPVAAFILLVVSHAWPLTLEEPIHWQWWRPIAVGQLSFWPLFAGLVGVRLRWPFTCLIIGSALGIGMLWLCAWQLPERRLDWMDRELAVLSVLALLALPILVLGAYSATARLPKSNSPSSWHTVGSVAIGSTKCGLLISLIVTVVLIVPWLCLARAPVIQADFAMVVFVALVGTLALSATIVLWGVMMALVQEQRPLRWRRIALTSTLITIAALGVALWYAKPFLNHYFARQELLVQGAILRQHGVSYQGKEPDVPFWRAWATENLAPVTDVDIDATKTSPQALAQIADLLGKDIDLAIDNPNADLKWLENLRPSPNVTSLRLTYGWRLFEANVSRIGDDEMAYLTRLPNLKRLYLLKTGVTGRGLQSLNSLPALRELSIVGAPLDNNGLSSVANLTKLESLSIAGTKITDAGLAHLAGLTNLTELNLAANRIRDAGLTHLKQLVQLDTLSLRSNPIDGSGLAHLAGLQILCSLNLSATQLDDESLRHLATLTELESLSISQSRISGDGCRYLSQLPKLDSLDLRESQLHDAGLMSAAALPWRVKLSLGDNRTLSIPGILQMHQERARLQALPDATDVVYDEIIHDPLDDDIAPDEARFPPDDELLNDDLNEDARHGMVEPFAEWLEEAGDSQDEVGEELVDAEIEVEHNVIVLYQYEVSDELIEAYRQRVLGEPDSQSNDEVHEDTSDFLND